MTPLNSSEMIDAVTAIGEQFRKMTEFTTEQARNTLNTTQEELRQNLNKAQQVQSDLAPMLVRLNDQNSQLASAAFNTFWDASLSLGKLAAWGHEKAEQALVHDFEEGKQIREEGASLLRDSIEQARSQQAELFRLTLDSVRLGAFFAAKTVRREGEAQPQV